VSYVKERWEFEGFVNKKFAGYVEFENDIMCECGVSIKDYEPQFQRYDIDCIGVTFDTENDVFSICFELVLNTLERLLKEGDVVEVRVGKKEVYTSRKPVTTFESNENNDVSLIDLIYIG